MLLSAMRRDFIRFDLIEFLWSAQFKTKSKSKSNLVAIFATPFPFRFIHPPPLLLHSRSFRGNVCARFACSFYVLIKKCRLVRVSI